jgi:DNA-binding PadR family transcriptional regulator
MDLSAIDQEVLLAAMALHPNAYGVSIADHIERRTGNNRSIAGIYTAIDRLEKKGYLKSRLGESTATRGGKRKLYVTITAPGQSTLRQSLQAIDSLRRGLPWKEAMA